MSRAEFAAYWGCSKVEVAWHVKEVRTRLDARSRAHAVALAMRHSLLRDQPFLEGFLTPMAKSLLRVIHFFGDSSQNATAWECAGSQSSSGCPSRHVRRCIICFEFDYRVSTDGGALSNGTAGSTGYGSYHLESRTGQKQTARLDFGRARDRSGLGSLRRDRAGACHSTEQAECQPDCTRVGTYTPSRYAFPSKQHR